MPELTKSHWVFIKPFVLRWLLGGHLHKHLRRRFPNYVDGIPVCLSPAEVKMECDWFLTQDSGNWVKAVLVKFFASTLPGFLGASAACDPVALRSLREEVSPFNTWITSVQASMKKAYQDASLFEVSVGPEVGICGLPPGAGSAPQPKQFTAVRGPPGWVIKVGRYTMQLRGLDETARYDKYIQRWDLFPLTQEGEDFYLKELGRFMAPRWRRADFTHPRAVAILPSQAYPGPAVGSIIADEGENDSFSVSWEQQGRRKKVLLGGESDAAVAAVFPAEPQPSTSHAWDTRGAMPVSGWEEPSFRPPADHSYPTAPVSRSGGEGEGSRWPTAAVADWSTYHGGETWAHTSENTERGEEGRRQDLSPPNGSGSARPDFFFYQEAATAGLSGETTGEGGPSGLTPNIRGGDGPDETILS